MMLTRRQLCVGATAAACSTVAGRFLPGGRASAQSASPILVAIMLRGGLDGLSVLVPHSDPRYRALRTQTRILPPGELEGALELGGALGLHPALQPLLPLYRSERIAFLTGVGSPLDSRSHFEAQRLMELGVVHEGRLRRGFLNRVLEQIHGGQPLVGVAASGRLPVLLRGPMPTITLGPLLGLSSGGGWKRRERLLDALHARASDPVRESALRALTAMRLLEPAAAQPKHAGSYPKGSLGRDLAAIARLIRSGLDVPVFYAEAGGWDTHAGQGAGGGLLARRLAHVAGALAAFDADLGPESPRVVTVCFTEFGRTAAENGSMGTDHGHGSVAFVMGDAVAGGRTLGAPPDLAASALYQGRDLQVTTDYRSLFGEVLACHLGVADMAAVFPGFDPSAARLPGLMRN